MSVITVEQINGEIAALGEERPTYQVMEKLAALYTVRDHLVLGIESKAQEVTCTNEIPHISDTDFGKAIEGKDQKDVWPVMDELASTLSLVQPKLYEGLMNKLTLLG